MTQWKTHAEQFTRMIDIDKTKLDELFFFFLNFRADTDEMMLFAVNKLCQWQRTIHQKYTYMYEHRLLYMNCLNYGQLAC